MRFIDICHLHFEDCHEFLFSVHFYTCHHNLFSFYKRKLKKTTFKDCSLHEVDFTETDLTNTVFDNCDLNRATFSNSILEKVDFRTAYNYSFDPDVNRIKKAKFSSAGISGLLDKYYIQIEKISGDQAHNYFDARLSLLKIFFTPAVISSVVIRA